LRLPGAGGRARAQAGVRKADPLREGSRHRGPPRPAHRRPRLRPALPRKPAALPRRPVTSRGARLLERPSSEVESPPMAGGEDALERELDIPEVLPLLPVRDVVVFPAMVVPLFVSREIGCATGLAWTPYGGELLRVEA